MSFDVSAFGNALFISLPPGLVGNGLVIFYGLILLFALGQTLGDWARLRLPQWGAFLFLLVAGAALAQLLVLRFPANILPTPGQPIEPQRPGLALLALVPAFLAGGWLGVGPALIVGAVTGLTRAAWETYSIFTPFELAFLAGMAAWCFRQDYRGWVASALRHPLLVGILLGGLLWPGLFVSYFAYFETNELAGSSPSSVLAFLPAAVDYVTSLVLAAAPVFFGQAALAGLAVELARYSLPTLWPRLRGSIPPPYLSSLNRRLQFILIPLFLFGIAALFWTDITIATRESTRLVVDQMARAAQNAGADIPFFIQTGSSLIREIADGQEWIGISSLEQTAALLQNMRALPFFKQLRLLDDDLRVTATAPPADATDDLPFGDDLRGLADLALQGLPQNVVILPAGDSPVEIVFFTPVTDVATRQPVGVLMGRAELATNPLMQSVVNNLSGLAGGQGLGFIVDDRGQIIYHPQPEMLRQPFAPEASADPLATTLSGANAYVDRGPDGTRRLVLYYPVPTHPWGVVVMVPYRVVLEQSAQIATPIILILLLVGSLGLGLVSIIATRVTRPAVDLALAAQRISEDQLEEPVRVSGEDEIGQAGRAFERMRQKLRARLSELRLLLKVSQNVAASLDLDEALPPILQGALSATNAAGARIVLMPAEDVPLASGTPAYMTFADGPMAQIIAPLDRSVLELTRAEGRAVIENLARARAVLDVAPMVGKLHALVALPLRQETMFYGALWLGYDQPHTFSESEVGFLTTLAGQAAVAIANARLFDTAEQGRRRLAAILASTPDAVVVTDRNDRILLLNPAAEAAFELTGKPVIGRMVTEALPLRDLAKLIQSSSGASNTGEFQINTGRTLYASISPIINADGATLGSVCVLRDVTHFKEVDLMKSEFVATVSHDLRAPLTFMRGYATMMPMVGQLNDKQKEFADKIIIGIEQMTKLIDDLLDLGRIEAGVGLAQEPCRLDDIVHGIVDTLQPVAANKGLTLTLEMPSNLPLISGDQTLLRQAITNLVDNALKYTPSGGQVRVNVSAQESKFRVAVSDSGMGIAPADQAHLFEKFFRVKQRGSTQVKGSGLGLAIVKSIVERHGGRVWMESKLGKGSTFFVELPRNGVNG